MTTVIFRVDASRQIGTGHLVRCRTLARELAGDGAEVRFVCRAHDDHAAQLLAAEAFEVATLPMPTRRSVCRGTAEYARWVGMPQQDDAAQTISALGQVRPEWLVVDHYGLDREWERCLRPHVAHIMAIDDLGQRPHDCDVLLDQNCSDPMIDRYESCLSGECIRLFGPRYALLAPEYRAAARTRRIRGKIKRVLVFFGGIDAVNATGLALDALSAAELRHLDVDVVIGPGNVHRRALVDVAERRGRTTLHDPMPSLAPLMARADLGIGAGGTTTWERLCVGLPSLVVSIAENQIPSCQALSARGLIRYAGTYDDMSTDRLAMEITTLVADEQAVAELSRRGPLEVDGCGASRVANYLLKFGR